METMLHRVTLATPHRSHTGKRLALNSVNTGYKAAEKVSNSKKHLAI